MIFLHRLIDRSIPSVNGKPDGSKNRWYPITAVVSLQCVFRFRFNHCDIGELLNLRGVFNLLLGFVMIFGFMNTEYAWRLLGELKKLQRKIVLLELKVCRWIVKTWFSICTVPLDSQSPEKYLCVCNKSKLIFPIRSLLIEKESSAKSSQYGLHKAASFVSRKLVNDRPMDTNNSNAIQTLIAHHFFRFPNDRAHDPDQLNCSSRHPPKIASIMRPTRFAQRKHRTPLVPPPTSNQSSDGQCCSASKIPTKINYVKF